MTQGRSYHVDDPATAQDSVWFNRLVQQMQHNIRVALNEVETMDTTAMDDPEQEKRFNERMKGIEEMQNILSYLQQRRYAYMRQSSRAMDINKFL